MAFVRVSVFAAHLVVAGIVGLLCVVPAIAADPQVDKDGKPIGQRLNGAGKPQQPAPRPNAAPAAPPQRVVVPPPAQQARPAPLQRPTTPAQQRVIAPVPPQPDLRRDVRRDAERGNDRGREQDRRYSGQDSGQRRDSGERRFDGDRRYEGGRRNDGDRRFEGNERRRDGDRYGRQRRFALGAGVVIIGGILGYELYRGRDREDVFERCDRTFPDFDYNSGSFVNEDGEREVCPYLVD